MAKDDVLELEGIVVEALPNAMFQVKLENEHQKRRQELFKFISLAVKKVNKEKNEEKRSELMVDLGAKIEARKEKIGSEYTDKLLQIDKAVNAQLAELAKKNGYTLVLTKDAVLYYENDLTEEMAKIVK